MRRYLVLFRGKAMREYSLKGKRCFYTPNATQRCGIANWRGVHGATLFESIAATNGVVNLDLTYRRNFDNTVGVDDYTIVALEVRA
jgi:hypothetical protein